MRAMRTPLECVHAYLDAFAARDVEGMVALADPGVEFVTPRGSQWGHQAIRNFMQRQTYGVAMSGELLRTFAGGDTVVTEGRVELRYADTGELAEESRSSTVYVVRDGRLVRLTPQPDLSSALREAGLTDADEVPAARNDSRTRRT